MATTQEIIDYYANLLIVQYISKPKAFATIQTMVSNIIMDQLPTQVQNAFNVDYSVGVQLDILGKYAGLSRYVYNFTGPITLDDDDFRTMIKVAIIKNSSGSSLYDIQQLLYDFFPGTILIFDYRTMRISYYLDSSLGSIDLAEVFVKSGFLPKPMAVAQSALIYSPNVNSFFGYRNYFIATANNSPFNSYLDYKLDEPWLSYKNAISL